MDGVVDALAVVVVFLAAVDLAGEGRVAAVVDFFVVDWVVDALVVVVVFLIAVDFAGAVFDSDFAEPALVLGLRWLTGSSGLEKRTFGTQMVVIWSFSLSSRITWPRAVRPMTGASSRRIAFGASLARWIVRCVVGFAETTPATRT